MSIFTDIEEFFSGIFKKVKPGLAYLEANIPVKAIEIAEQLLKDVQADKSWSVILAELIAAAKADGIELIEGAAAITLNTAQSNLIATGDIQPPKPAAPENVA